MILRRFMKHVTDQNWFAVGLDVIVVITGIFLGMQVSEWNDERKDKLIEIEYIERLIDNLNKDLAYSEFVQSRAQQAIGNIHFLQACLEDDETLKTDHQRFASSVRMISWAAFPGINDGTYAELTSTGRLVLIRNIETRNSLSDFYRRVESSVQWNGILRELSLRYREAMSGLLPIDFEIALRSDSQYDVGYEEALEIKKNYLKRENLVNLIPSMASLQANILDRQSGIEEQILALQSELNNYLMTLKGEVVT